MLRIFCRRNLGLLTVAAALCLTGCGRNAQKAVNVVGSTSIQPFAESLAQAFGQTAGNPSVEVQGGGSTAGLQAVENGLTEIGMCSRALTEEESKKFTGTVIARDGLAIIVHPSNPVTNLTTEQLRGLFDGKITNWKEVGGPDLKVQPITREEGSGTRECFVKLVMDKDTIIKEALTQESNGSVSEMVKGDATAVGYMSLGLVGKELKALSIDGVAPTHQEVLANKYKLVRPFLFVSKAQISPEAQKFVDYVLSADAQALLEKEGLVRAK